MTLNKKQLCDRFRDIAKCTHADANFVVDTLSSIIMEELLRVVAQDKDPKKYLLSAQQQQLLVDKWIQQSITVEYFFGCWPLNS